MSEQKYRQRGYKDSDRDDGQRRSSGPRPKKDGPRGRGLGAPSETLFRCARCGEKRPWLDDLETNATCSGCGSDLHTCTNCRFMDSSVRNECRQPIEERIPRKSNANECDLFEPKLVQEVEADKAAPGDPRAAFDALFK